MTYAMILQNMVIGVLQNQKTKPHWPPDPLGHPVIAVACDESVEIGMVYDSETGTFSEYIPPELEPTQLDEIQQTQIDIMDAIATQFEENIENQLLQMEVLATIYETQLEMGGK